MSGSGLPWVVVAGIGENLFVYQTTFNSKGLGCMGWPMVRVRIWMALESIYEGALNGCQLLAIA
jgi:hypothetical protein